MSSEKSTNWAEDHRLGLVLHKALADVSIQSNKLTGKNKQSLQMEWLEFSTLEWDDMEIHWLQHFDEWGK